MCYTDNKGSVQGREAAIVEKEDALAYMTFESAPEQGLIWSEMVNDFDVLAKCAMHVH